MVDIIIRELSNIPHNTSGMVTLVDVDNDEVAPNGTHEIFFFSCSIPPKTRFLSLQTHKFPLLLCFRHHQLQWKKQAKLITCREDRTCCARHH